MSALSGVSRPVLTSDEAAAAKALAAGAGASGVLPVLLLGDSNTAISFDSGPTPTAIVDNGNGTATVTFGSSHNWAVGGRISISNTTDRKFNVFSAEVTAVTTTTPITVTYRLGGRTSPVVSGSLSSSVTQHMGRYSCIGYAGWLEALQGRSLNAIFAAAGGADSTQALTMYQDALPEALAARCSDCIVMIGTNDVYARAWDFATVRASAKALLDRIRATFPGRIWVVTPPPYNSAGAGWSSAKQTVMNRYVRWLWRYSSLLGATPIDSWRTTQNGVTFVNEAAANPDAATGFLGADNVHTTSRGALAIARKINDQWRQVQSFSGFGFAGGHAATQNQNNALANSRLTGTTGTKTAGAGTINGTVPTSWTVQIDSGTGVLDLTSPARVASVDGDADGNNLQVVLSGSATTWRFATTASFSGSLVAGERRQGYVPIRITGMAGVTGIEIVMFGVKSSGGNENLGFVGNSQALTGDFEGCLRLPEWVVPSGLTSLTMFVRFTAGTAGTFIIGKPSFELIE